MKKLFLFTALIATAFLFKINQLNQNAIVASDTPITEYSMVIDTKMPWAFGQDIAAVEMARPCALLQRIK